MMRALSLSVVEEIDLCQWRARAPLGGLGAMAPRGSPRAPPPGGRRPTTPRGPRSSRDALPAGVLQRPLSREGHEGHEPAEEEEVRETGGGALGGEGVPSDTPLRSGRARRAARAAAAGTKDEVALPHSPTALSLLSENEPPALQPRHRHCHLYLHAARMT